MLPVSLVAVVAIKLWIVDSGFPQVELGSSVLKAAVQTKLTMTRPRIEASEWQAAPKAAKPPERELGRQKSAADDDEAKTMHGMKAEIIANTKKACS